MLDALPGEVRSGGGPSGGPSGADHPAKLIETLRQLPLPLADRNSVIDYLVGQGAPRKNALHAL